MTEKATYPHSAISTWSGFVYQGKVALYHSLSLLVENDDEFELQLDSTDDFSIYKNKALVSAHQVKAISCNSRSNKKCQEALEKCAEISGDKIKGTKRYIHISVKIKDNGNYTGSNSEVVEFYPYCNKKRYCALNEIEPLTIDLLKKVLSRVDDGQTICDRDVELKYYFLADVINSKVIHIHHQNQNQGVPENKAAYENRIGSQEILEILRNNLREDINYFAAEHRVRLLGYLEQMTSESLPECSPEQYERLERLSRHLQALELNVFKRLCQTVDPSESFTKIKKMEISRYLKLIKDLSPEPIFKEMPHYTDRKSEFYLPTAISLNDDEIEEFQSNIKENLGRNGNLVVILYEYSSLIASRVVNKFDIDVKITAATDDDRINMACEGRITKPYRINVLTKLDAEKKINAV